MELDRNSLRQLWGKLVAESWSNPKLRSRLLADPAAVLREHNAALPDGLKVRALDDDGQTLYLPLPQKPPAGELGESELDAVAGGVLAAPAATSTIGVRHVNKIDPIATVEILGPVVV